MAAAAVAALAPGAALAAPVISGADTDVWNRAAPTPSYTVRTGEPGDSLVWSVDADPTSLREGRSPLTIDLPDLADGVHRLLVAQFGEDGLERAARTFRIDRTPPSVTIARPALGDTVSLGGILTADYACAGAVRCTGPVPSGDPVATGTAGAATFTVTAVDDAANETVASATYTVLVPPAAPVAPAPDTSADTSPPTATAQAVPPPAPPAAPPAATAPATRPTAPPLVTVNAGILRPAAGTLVGTRRPLLRWRARPGASLYNVQVFRVRGTATPVKVLSAFPRRNRLRVPARRLVPGGRYIWRVWPFVGARYLARPLGISNFRLAR